MKKLSSKGVLLQQQIWTDYVRCMVNRKGDTKLYPLDVTCAWLSWLARQMWAHNQTIFSLEQFQPDWLPKGQRILYRWSIGLLFVFGMTLFGETAWALTYWLPMWLFMGVAINPIQGLLAYLPLQLGEGLCCGLYFGLWTIRPFEVLTWSWTDIKSRLLVGLSLVMSGGAMFLFSKELRAKIIGKQLTERLSLSPNEGIQRSAKNGLLAWVLLTPFVGISMGLFAMLHAWLSFGLGRGLVLGLVLGLLYGLYNALFLGLLTGLLLGLGAFIQHYILRFWLWRTRVFPWKAVSFLEDATARILLRRVGGGYSFTHRLLQEYFANLETTLPSATSPTAPPIQKTPLP